MGEGHGRLNMYVRAGFFAVIVLVACSLLLTGAPGVSVAQTVIATAPVGDNPLGVGVNPATNKVYVADWGLNDVYVIDGVTDTVTATIPAGLGPSGIGVNPTTDKVYVANDSSDNVSVIDGATSTVIATIPVGDMPNGLGVNTNTNMVYVSNYYSDNVSVIDGATDTVINIITVGSRPRGVGVNPTTDKVYVANDSSDNVSVIDGATGTVSGTIPVGDVPTDIGLNPTTNKVYVANAGSDDVSVIDGTSDAVITTIPVGSQPYGVDANPFTNQVYVANTISDDVSVIDGASDTVTSTVTVGDLPYGISANPVTAKIYVTNVNSDDVTVISDIPVPATSGISPDHTAAGGGGFTLTVNGSGFIGGSEVRWNGSSRATTYVSDTQLTAAITAADIEVAGTADVTVFNPAPDGGTSGTQVFTVTPTVTSIDPAIGINEGTISITDLAGTGFYGTPTVTLSKLGQPDITATNVVVVSSTRITCDFDLTGAVTGTWDVTVTNPDTQSATLRFGFRVMLGWGSLQSWGYNSTGVVSNTPAGNDFVAVGAGGWGGHAVALRSNGSLVSWGNQTSVPSGNDFVMLSVGQDHNLALRSNGSIAAWGSYDYYGMISNTPAGTGFVAVEAGEWHSMALRSDGSIAAWGDNSYGQLNVPAGNDFVALAAGGMHCAALRSDGSLVSWGYNGGGQVTNTPAGNDFVAVAAGTWNSMALRSDGSLAVWGSGSPTPAGAYKAMAGGYFTLAVRSDGSIETWGSSNNYGQLNAPAGNDFLAVTAGHATGVALAQHPAPTVTSLDPAIGTNEGTVSVTNLAGTGFYGTPTVTLSKLGQPDIAATNVVAVSPTRITCDFDLTGAAPGTWDVTVTNHDNQSATLRFGFRVQSAPGSIVSWGDDSGHQLSDAPTALDFVQVAGDLAYGLALKEDGSIAAWGDDTFRQVSDAPTGTGYIAVDSGWAFGLALTADGSIVAWGDDVTDQVKDAPAGNGFVGIAGGMSHAVALKSDGSLVSWGDDGYGKVSGTPAGNDYVAVAAGQVHSMALKSDGSIVAWGENTYSQCDVAAPNSGFTAISAGVWQSLGLRSDGSLAIWGYTGDGMWPVPAGNDFVQISCGAWYNLALKSDGTIAAWGNNDQTQCQVPAGSDFTEVAAGGAFGLALCPPYEINATVPGGYGSVDPVSQLIGYGRDAVIDLAPDPGYFISSLIDNGALQALSDPYNIGDVKEDHEVTVHFSPLTVLSIGPRFSGNATSITGATLTGQNFIDGATVRLTRAGSDDIAATNVIWVSSTEITCDFDLTGAVSGAWNVVVTNPDAISGQLTNGFFVGTMSGWGWGYNFFGECNVPDGIDFVAICGGYYHSLALRSDGSLVSWGNDGEGEVSNTPAGNDFLAVSSGAYHSLALSSDGTIAAWGSNGDGQCNVPAGNDFVAIAAGYSHSLALRSDGTVAAWGNNGNGQCNVPAGNDFVAIAGGAYHSLALRSDGTIAAWGSNSNGQSNVPAGNDFVAIAGGAYHSLALRSNGSLVSWGYNGNGQVSNTPSGSDFIEIGCGPSAYHSLALRSDGSIAAWGYNANGECNVPAGDDFVLVAAGGNHSLALCRPYTVTASVGGSGLGGSVDPLSQLVGYGRTAQIDIITDARWHMVSLTDNGAPQALTGTYVIPNVREDHEVVVTFAAEIAVTVNGGHGTVDPAYQEAVSGSDAVIDLLPDPGYHVTFISDNGMPMPLSDPYVIPAVDGPHDVLVVYSIGEVNVNAYVTGGHGSVSPAGQSVTYGGIATIDITPESGYMIESVTDNDVPVAGPFTAPYTYTIDPVTEVHNVVVTFAASSYDVNATVFFGGGDVNPATQSVAYDGTASIDLIPDTGYHASHILDNGAPVAVADPYVINNVTEVHDVVVFFELDTYTITASVDGSGSVSGAGDYQYGSTATLTATPDAGWSFVNWTEDAGGTVVSTDAAYSFTVTGDLDLTAHFTYPWVNSIMPKYMAAPGPVSVVLNGSGFLPGATVRLTRMGSPDVAATNVVVVSPTEITCDFDLTGTATGGWNLSFENPDGGWNSLHGCFFAGGMSGIGWGYNGSGQTSFPDSNDFVQASAGDNFSLGLRSDGSIAAWGDNGYGQLSGRPTTNDFVQVAAGSAHCLALRSDGTLYSWGYDVDRQVRDTPTDSGYVAIAAGMYHSLALRADGSMVAWGLNGNGQCNVPAGTYLKMAGGNWHTLAVRADGSLAAWGYNTSGQCNVPAGTDFVEVDAGASHSMALCSDGSIAGWGDNTDGQCNVPAGNNFTTVASGQMHGLAVRSDSSVAAWGYDGSGQVSGTPTDKDYVAISGGAWDSLVLCRPFEVTASVGGGGGGAVDPDSQRVGYGRDATIDLLPDANYHVAAITDNGVPQTVADPYVVSNVREARDVVVDFALDTYMITASTAGNGSVDGAGLYDYGSIATLTATPDIGWHFVNWTDSVGEVSTDPIFSFTVTGDWDLTAHFAIDTFAVNASVFYTDHGTVDPTTQTIDYGSPASIDLIPAVGYHASYILDNGMPVTVADPYVIASVTEAHNVIAFFAPNPYTISASIDPAGSGSVSGAGTYDYGSTANLNAMPAAGWHFVNWTEGGTEVSTDAAYSFTVTGDRALAAHFATAVVISAMPKYSGDASSVHLADLHGSGFLPGATVRLTRAGSTEINATGVVVMSDTQIACDLNLSGAATGAWNVTVTNPDGGSGYLANAFFVGIMSGTGWGYNYYGQCDVPDSNDYVQIAGGEGHSLALRSDGYLAAWGDDTYGQVSGAPTGPGFVSVASGYYHSLALNSSGIIDAWGFNDDAQVSGAPTGPGFVSVAAGGYHSMTLLADGSILSWGNDDYGQVSNTPTGNDYVQIAGGEGHSLALRSDGSIVGWGLDNFGQVSNTPAGNDFVAVAGGFFHSLALRSDGSLVAWGYDDNGQVSNAPAGNDFVQISAGEWHNLALRSDGSLVAWGYDDNGQVSNTPAGNEFTAVSGGGAHSLALCRPYEVNASVGGGGGGMVDPEAQRVGYGRDATIDLYPDTNWHVAGITDNGVPQALDNPYTIYSVTQAHDVEVTFALDTYDITAAVDGSGSVDGAGTYGWGTEATLTATPDTGWHFVNWTDPVGEVSTDPILSFTVTGDWDLTAHFAIDTFDINASVYYTGHGTLDPATQTVDYGSTATIDFTPETGYHVAYILDNGIPRTVADSYVIPAVAADHTVIVTFAINTYTIGVTSAGHGTASGGGVYEHFETAELTATPDTGYHFVNWTEGGTEVSVDPAYSFIVTGARDLTAHFAINTYAVTAWVAGSGGTVSPATQTVDWGTDAAIDITPAARYHIASITDNDVSAAVSNPFVIGNVTETHNVAVTFAPDTRTWYLAEGCTAGGTETWVLVENINPTPVELNITFATAEGLVAPAELQGYELAANTRASFNAGSYAVSYDLSTTVAANGGNVVVERAMYGAERTWATASIGSENPAGTWYLAEGCTGEGFETWVLVMNPGDSAVTVDLTLMTGAGEQAPAGLQDVAIPANSRKSFNLGEYVTDYDVSTLVGASGDVVAERAMYGNGRAWAHDSIGTSTTAPLWYLAEGCTGEGFETWVLVQNPGAAAVTVDLTLMTGAGEQAPAGLQDVAIPANSRKSFNLGEYVTDYDVSTLVGASGDVVCERAMYNTERTWGTGSIGAVTPASTWYLAEGSTGAGFETWVLVQNPGASAVTVDLSFMTSTGLVAGPQDVTIPAGSRKSFNLGDYVTDYNVSTEVTASGGVVCERAMYGAGRTWAHDSVGYTP